MIPISKQRPAKRGMRHKTPTKLVGVTKTLLRQLHAQMAEWRERANDSMPAALYMPEAYLNSFLYPLYDSVRFLRLMPTQREKMVEEVLSKAAREYVQLVNRAVEQAQEELPIGGMPIGNCRRMVAEAVEQVVSQSAIDLFDAPVHLDLFTDVIWTSVKKHLETSQNFPVQLDIDDSRYIEWLQHRQLFFSTHYEQK